MKYIHCSFPIIKIMGWDSLHRIFRSWICISYCFLYGFIRWVSGWGENIYSVWADEGKAIIWGFL